MHSSMPSSLPRSLGSIIQYAVLAVLAYILAGAPLLSMLTGDSSFSSSSLLSSSYPSNVGAKARHGAVDAGKLDSLVIPEKNLSCAEHGYKGVYVLSREPLVVYIEGFLGEGEGEEVVGLSEPHFTPSTIWNLGTESLNPNIRNSEKAPLPRSHTVKCIENRARTFQGWQPDVFVEKLWSQRYGVGGHYTYHYDWSTAKKKSGRVSSFMVYIEGNCTGGGTHFPRLKRPGGREWCRFIECPSSNSSSSDTTTTKIGKGGQGKTVVGERSKEDLSHGVIFKPIKGNAVFWENMRSDGSGYAESWHAGLPVETGRKIGLNIWSWKIEGYVPPSMEEEL
ncbi:hypothetical protein EJ02DRAFT_509603 [Clathrospora elynae]|uniref:Prolyl 4-hydroxylase alpha subunit domain-containing protein n=1 Tax=Clathrospora elynae TaxID=706981 RepID=A0A6A5T0D4_9PLEO|nr:hypothetical protein EJ02DRAFT_509603 [Clathrospora elynae]